jgi:hypothetical protein
LINPFDLFYICAYLGSSASNSPHQTGADAAADHRESLLVGALIVHAVNDLVPHPQENDLGEQKEPFMYWDAEDGTTAASALIKRYVFVVVSFVILSCMIKIPCPAPTKTYLLISADAAAFFGACYH